jgi:D-alanyl-lipoteichoic acid acyltransferase DltB (MBOAT superfamily)
MNLAMVHSLEFFGFSVVVLVLYYLLTRQKQNVLLLVASYVFYISITWYFALILVFMTIGNYVLGKKIEIKNHKKKWLGIGIGLNVVVLSFFKFADFFVPDILGLLSQLGFHIQTKGLKILLPIGLSFYVFQAISYLVDVYRMQMPACLNPVDFALYLAYFPKLTAGPIERAQTFLPKLAKQRVFDNELLSRSFTLIIIGLVRKVVIADTLLQAIPPKLYETPLEFSAIQLAAWILAFTFGVYNDFCGYTNIVRGVSGFFGIELSRNFAIPFFSRNFSEFWNRWHITLSHWLRDYIYYPISRALVRRNPSLSNPLNVVIPPVVTMAVCGLWHGASWNFVAWGVTMGIFLAFERLFSLWKSVVVPPDRKPLYKQVIAALRIFVLFLFSLIIIRSNIYSGGQFFLGLFTNIQWVLPHSRVFIVIIPSLWIDVIQYRRKNEMAFLSWPLPVRALLLATAILAIFLFSQSKIPTPYIYQGF